MSAGPPIVVRYDVQNSDKVASETKKVETSLNALRTSAGQTTLSVKQMESGFNANALGNFSGAVQSADSRVSGFRAKLAGIGTQLTQNATSFGVATASIWGVYNAYDSLEKVQIRAHAAAQRVSTLETTIATLTNRRTEAVAKGNLSAEEMAILDDRITNAHGKLAVAQERNADLQQDVNEAWGAFASQVGPQAIAAGGSVVQLVTNLRGSMTGVVPAIKNFFGSFGGGGQIMSATRQESLLLGQGIGNLKGPMEGAAIATRGLSTAMKGLLIGTGVGIAIAAIGLIAEHFMQTAEASESSTGDIEASLDEMGSSFDESEDVVGEWGDEMARVSESASTSVKTEIAKITHELDVFAAYQQMQLAKMKLARLEAERDAQVQPTPKEDVRRQGRFGGMPQHAPAQTAEIGELDAKINKAKADADLATEAFNRTKLAVASVATGAGSLDEVAEKTERLKKEAIEVAKLPIGDRFKMWQDGKLEKSVVGVATAYEIFKETYMSYHAATKDEPKLTQEQIEADQKQTDAIREKMKAIIDENNAKNEEKRIEQESLDIKKMIVAQTFGEAEAAQKAGESNADYKNRMTELSDIGQKRIDEEKAYALGLIETAVNLGINVTQQQALSDAISQGNEAVLELIISQDTLNNILSDGAREQKNIALGLVEGRNAAVAWYDQMVKQIAIDRQFSLDQDVIYHKFADALPAGIDLTKEQMTSLIVSFNDAGKYGMAMSQVLDEAFSASRSALQDLIDTAVEGGEDWKDKWNDIKDTIPKNLRTESKEFLDDQAEMGRTLDDVIPKLEIYRGIWDNLNKKEKSSATKDMAGDIEKLGNELDDVTKIDIQSTIIDPLLALKKDGLTTAEFNVWEGFFNLYNQLFKEGGGIDDNDVKKLQDYVANSKGMGDLATATGDTADAYAELTPEQQKIADNNKIKAAIDAQTGAFELQKTYVDALNESLEHRAELMNNETNGGFTNVGFQQNSPKGVPFNKGVEPEKPTQTNVIIGADTLQFDQAVLRVKTEVAAIDALAPIVDFKGDHSSTGNFMKAAKDVIKTVTEIDKLRPIVDFLGDHSHSGNFMKAAGDVVKVVKAIDALRPIVDLLADHRQFMRAASEVEARVKKIDGMTATVTIKAERKGNFSAQHGMHATLGQDAWIYAHKDERVDITPPEHKSAFHKVEGGGQTVSGFSGPIAIHLEVPLVLGYDEVKKIVKDIYIENTGMFNT